MGILEWKKEVDVKVYSLLPELVKGKTIWIQMERDEEEEDLELDLEPDLCKYSLMLPLTTLLP